MAAKQPMSHMPKRLDLPHAQRPSWIERGGEIFGAQPDETGPLGGGAGYRRIVTGGDHVVRTEADLIAALAQARAGQVIFVDPRAELDFTDRVFLDGFVLRVPGGVTLASDRGRDVSVGAMLRSRAFQTQPLIEYTIFQDNKHDVASPGVPGCGHEARHNLVLAATESHRFPPTGDEYGQDHVFDVHGGRDRLDGTDIAGTWVRIANNTVVPNVVCVNIRGVPQKGAEIHHNWFLNPEPGPATILSGGNTSVAHNLYGNPPRRGAA
jgi:hypothetical protein